MTSRESIPFFRTMIFFAPASKTHFGVAYSSSPVPEVTKRSAIFLPRAIQRWAGASTTFQVNFPSSGSRLDHGMRM